MGKSRVLAILSILAIYWLACSPNPVLVGVTQSLYHSEDGRFSFKRIGLCHQLRTHFLKRSAKAATGCPAR
jgi:hypothetical protein